MTAGAQEPDAGTAVRELVQRTLAEIVDLPETDATELVESTPLESLGVDSLARAELAVVVEQELGILVPDDQWAALTTMGEMIAYLTVAHGRTDDPAEGAAGN